MEKFIEINLLKRLLLKIIGDFSLNLYGRHGIYHWGRVLENAFYISENLNVERDLLVLFAVLHDSKRVNEQYDKLHGIRAAKFVELINKEYLMLSENKLKILITACEGHNSMKFHKNLTIQACWDADRLDLLRAKINPSPEYLNLDISKKRSTIEWANKRSVSNSISDYTKYWIDLIK